ncbi:hypothetical protein BC830DRAFT_1167829 [Chytriomyces sp. MP71]|nr:hypothetical protein BC830DRAFT_1167829 [Chytriomyces sp. MP71]
MSDPIADGYEVGPKDDQLMEDTEVKVDPAFLKLKACRARERAGNSEGSRRRGLAASMDVDRDEDEAGVDRVLVDVGGRHEIVGNLGCLNLAVPFEHAYHHFWLLHQCGLPESHEGMPLHYVKEAAIVQSFSERGLNDRMRHVDTGICVEVEQPQRQKITIDNFDSTEVEGSQFI